MDCIRVTGEFGIVVRLASLNERGTTLDKLLVALETSAPFDSNDEIASFGPHFGAEAAETLVRRLSDLGLKYFEDFFEFSGDFPKWSAFKLSAASAPEQRHERGHNEPSESARPTDAEVEAAARVLDKAGRHHHWWPKTIKPYDEFAKTDPIAKSEFEGIVEQMLMAASAAKRNTETL
jgi:hypothetical protein